MTIWNRLVEILEKGDSAVLLVVASSSGSSPGKPGFRMLIGSDGTLAGSIGGGSMEHDLVKQAGEILEKGSGGPLLKKAVHSEKASPENRSGNICDGSQEIVLCPCFPADLPVFRKILQAYSTGGSYFISGSGPGFSEEHTFKHDNHLETDGDRWCYSERIRIPDTVYIFGGGHCCLALSAILSMLDMRTIVIDDREDVWTMNANDRVSQRIIRSYDDVSELIPDDGAAFVVIMTASHGGDETVLRQMLGKKLRYLGMLASRKKGEIILERMRKEGFSEDALSNIHTPIGIPIHSHTPAEIAVSIAAEIIRDRT